MVRQRYDRGEMRTTRNTLTIHHLNGRNGVKIYPQSGSCFQSNQTYFFSDDLPSKGTSFSIQGFAHAGI